MLNALSRGVNFGRRSPLTGGQFSTPNDILGSIRNRGSVHSDIWRGSAAALAERDAVAVFPIGGWWKEKPALKRWDRPARYTLIVSIRAPEVEVDLYAAIAIKLGVPIPAT